MRGHDSTCGPLRCVKDHRTRQEKLEDVASAPSASQGERDNAKNMLANMKAKGDPIRPPHVSQREGYQPPAAEEAQPAGRTWRMGYSFDGERSFEFDAKVEFDWSDLFKSATQRRDERRSQAEDEIREELRKARIAEDLRRMGFTMPGDPGFESEFTYQAGGANATFREASQGINDLRGQLRDELSKMSAEELFELFERTVGGNRGPTE